MKPFIPAAVASGLLTLSTAAPAGAQPVFVDPGPYGYYGPAFGPADPYIWGGRRYCWYFDGWRGPGWYWCGYGARYGYGWGGGWGWHGWRHGGFRARYGYDHGGYGGHWHGGGGFHGGHGGDHGGGGHGGGHGGGGHGGGHHH